MYTKYFGLTKRPFILSPDPDFLFMSRGHDLALTHLEYGVVHNVGFVALTGEVGAGKTTLLKYFFDKVSRSLDIAMIFNTHLDSRTLLEMLVKEFELTPVSESKSDLIAALYNHFLAQYAIKGRCVIVVDEAQNLPLEAFEELRMLSNLEAGSEFLLQIILVGQPQLRERLLHPALAQLTQRISVHYHLAPLSPEEVGSYIEHRLSVSGFNGAKPLFAPETISRIAEASGGIPRLINSICDASLTYTFADDAQQVSGDIIERVLVDNELLRASFNLNKRGIETGSGDSGPRTESSETALSLETESLLHRIAGRLEALEMRVMAMDAAGQDKTVAILQEMLVKEREKGAQLSQKLFSLSLKNKELRLELENLRTQQHLAASAREAHKRWRLFGVGKG
jgi:general secretion pathway protein A